MHTVETCFSLDSDIINLEVLENRYVAISTQSGEVRLNSCENYDNQLIIESDKLTSDVVAASFSPNVTLLAFAIDHSIYVIDTRFNETVNEIHIKAEDVSILTFDPSSEYLIVGTKYGRVFEYKFNNSSVLARLCSFPYDRQNLPKFFNNYVSAVAFHESKIACTGYGGAIFVMDLHVNTYRDIITHSKSRTNSLCFIGSEILLAGNTSGEILVISMQEDVKYEIIQTPFEDIRHIVEIPNTNFAFITSNEKYLAIIDYKNKEVINDSYARFHSKVVNISLLDEKTVVVALEDSDILKLNIPTTEQLDEIISLYPLPKIFKITHNATIVKNYKKYQVLEKKYEKIYNMATKALIQGDNKLAVKLLRDYADVESKKAGVHELFNTFKHYKKFRLLVSERRFLEAYRMVDKFPILKQTDHYKKMEHNWNEKFLQAQNELLAGKVKNAQKLLMLYKDAPSKKELCSFVFQHYKEFYAFLKALVKKDYITLDKIIEKHQSFKDIPAYKNLKTKIDGTIKLVENCVSKSNVALAKRHIQRLNDIPHIAKRVEELEERCEYISNLQDAYEKKDFSACYKLLDTKKYLQYIALGKALNKHWAKIVAKCEEYALQGSVEEIKKELGELINMNSRKGKLGDLFRVAYHTKIKKYIETSNAMFAQHSTESYLNIFGIDHEIIDIIKSFEKKFSKEIPYIDQGYKRGDREGWVISINDI
jgi:hypothetical protein